MYESIDTVSRDKNAIERVLNITLSKLKTMADTETVIGHPVNMADGSVIIPVSRVTMGYVGGGGEYKEDIYVKNKKETAGFPFAGGSGAALSMTPVGFLVGSEGNFKVVKMDSETNVEKLIDVASDIITKRIKGNA